MEKEKVIQVKLPADAVIEKLNAVVRTKVNFKDQWGETDYLFWGPKIENNVLSICILLIGIIAKQNFGIIFSFVFVVSYWIVKQNYLDKVTTDIKNVFRERELL